MKLKKLAIIGAVALLPTTVMAWPWSTDMMNQPSIKPQEGAPAPFAKRSVPVSGIPTTYKNREETRDLKNPFPPTAESIKTGRNLFKIYCAACHGLTGRADSPVTPKIGAIPLHEEYAQSLTEGWMWGTITFGSYVMPAYGKPGEGGGSNDLSPEERWHVVNYMRHQLIKDGAVKAAGAH
ncbi:MAG: cytochrome c [Gammaproteobacteria bacterium]|nr:cytochrome c [Gammaproteobacteria bacterium]